MLFLRPTILIYHARNDKELTGNSLANPDCHTRAQALHWKEIDVPVFGVSAADGPYEGSPSD